MEAKFVIPAHHANQFMMIDLHGNSPEESKATVNRWLSYAEEHNVSEFRFVTGRGNHPASDGERGKLYQEFLGWISNENHIKIDSIEKCDGYYKVKMKPVLKKGLFHILEDQLNKEFLSKDINQIKMLAEKGDAESQFLLGHCYQYGIGLDISEKDAVVWYEKSAGQN